MAQWVLWDDEKAEYKGMVRALPSQLEGRDSAYLNMLGYHELVVQMPEDVIQRFPALLGTSTFVKQADGRILQSFPNADFSVARVRGELVNEAKIAATREMGKTDWYVIRKAELGTELPADIASLRAKIRAHVDWLEGDIAKTPPRDLVDYQWFFPQDDTITMVNGVPLYIEPTPPPPGENGPEVPLQAPMPPSREPRDIHPDEVLNPPEHDPEEIHRPDLYTPPPVPEEPAREEPPATTDGAVPVFVEGETRPHLDANGMPVVSVYGYHTEDIGPRPDNE